MCGGDNAHRDSATRRYGASTDTSDQRSMILKSCRLRMVMRPNDSDQPDFLELGFDDVLVERLHDVLVRAGMERAGDVSDIVLGGAEHDLRPIAVRQPAQRRAGTRSRPSSACSSRAGRRRAFGCGRLRAPARRLRLRRSGTRVLREFAARPCGSRSSHQRPNSSSSQPSLQFLRGSAPRYALD